MSRRNLLRSAAAGLARDAIRRRPRWPRTRGPRKDIHSICGFPAGHRRRRVRALLRQEARGQARQDHHHREQGRRVRQHRDRIRREVQAGRLHDVHRAGQFVPGRRAEPVQEARLRSGQRLRARHDAVEAAVHSGRVRRQPVQDRRRSDRRSQAARRQGVLRVGRQHRASSAASSTRPISGSRRSR